MDLTVLMLTLAPAMHGLLALDTALVKGPSRQRIGVLAYAPFACGNDLGNGQVVYPLLGSGTALLTVLATIIADAEPEPITLMLPLLFASL